MQHAAQPVLLFFNLFCERKGDVKSFCIKKVQILINRENNQITAKSLLY